MSYWDKALSVDIKTTDNNPKDGKIWSMAVYGDEAKSSNYFIKSARQIESDLATGGVPFDREHLNGGSSASLFGDLERAADSGTRSPEGGLRGMFKHINDDSVLLMQNVNMKNGFVNSVLGDMGDSGNEIREKMRYSSYLDSGNTIKSDSILYTPPEVSNQRSAARNATQAYMRTGDMASFTEAGKSYDKMMAEYSRVASEGKGAVVVDMLDVTKATYAKAASQGFLNRQHVSAGTSMDFLAKVMLDRGPGTHGAASGARQQKQIYSKMMSMYEELQSGTVSDDTRGMLARIRAGQPYDSSRQFISSLDGAMKEIENSGFTRIRLDQYGPEFGLSEEDAVSRVTIHDKSGPSVDISRKNYGAIDRAPNNSTLGYFKTDSKSVAVQDVLRRFENVDTPGVNKSDFVKRYLEGGIDMEAESANLKNLGNEAPPMPQEKARVVDRATDMLAKAKGKLQGLEKKHVIGMALLATGGAAYAASGDNEKGAELRRREEKKQNDATLDHQLRTFTKPETYHGSSLADWKERTGHHQY
jgi:hypothetical protein